MVAQFDELLTVHAVTGAHRRISSDLLRDVYLVPLAPTFALDKLVDSPKAPWRASFEVAPTETLRAIEQALHAVMLATPNLRPDDVDLSNLDRDSRLHRHMAALIDLWQAADGALPPDLHVVRHVLNASAADALEPLPIINTQPASQPALAERRLRDVLLAHHGFVSEALASPWRQQQSRLSPQGPAASSLRRAIESLAGEEIAAQPLDNTLRFFTLRDHAEEAEFAAALSQRWCDEGVDAADIGLVVPGDPIARQHVASAFARVGIPIAGLAEAPVRRDIVSETLLNYLICLDRPAPAMALASLYTSPLMPWSLAVGRELAREVMRGRFEPWTARQLQGRAAQFFKALFSDAPSDAAQLGVRLDQLVQAANDAPERKEDVAVLRRQVGILKAGLRGDQPFNLVEIRKRVIIQPAVHAPAIRTVEGLTVIGEGDPPWRPVRRLIFMGMAAGRYPRASNTSSLFLESELTLLAERTGLVLPTRADHLRRQLLLFRQQLSSVLEEAVFLHPVRKADGQRQLPAAGLSLIARTITEDSAVTKGAAEPAAAPKSVDDVTSLMRDPWANGTPADIVAVETVAASALVVDLPPDGVLALGQDLLIARKTSKGEPASQSPSRLENLLVSPLAWVLEEFGAEQLIWAPEQYDPIIAGTLAHDVFEHLFPKNTALPDEQVIAENVPGLLAAAIRNRAPFLAASAWKVERQSLERDVVQAAKRWRRALIAAGATIVANEFDLSGNVLSLRLSGRADCLLQLPGDCLLVVDHKKSRTRKRKARMAAGWDLQVALYRYMLQNPFDPSPDLQAALASQPKIGIAYHLMNDGGILVHGIYPGPSAFHVLADDVSYAAEELLAHRIAEVRAGTVRLNRADDVGFFDKVANLSAYALQSNPLVNAFLLPVEADARITIDAIGSGERDSDGLG